MESQGILKKIRKIILNKYVLVLIIFMVFFLFFDKHNLVSRWKTGKRVKDLEKEIEFYNEEIRSNKQKVIEMQSGDETLERFAREQFYLKKDSEDVFIIKEE
ncbi:MAG TPA: septum formation initiator family protein [Bacteroidales bacterium]|nr:septum formation initiator family protein [Bacteroidales bacterium]